MAMITIDNVSAEPTVEEIRELEEAEKREPIFDEDCPEMTEDMLRQFHRMDSIPIKISASNMAKVRAMGHNTQQILSHLLDLAINDASMLRKCVQ